MTWVLDQLEVAKERGTKLDVRCNIRQAMEWFVLATKDVSEATVRNCWVATKILTPVQMHELETGIKRGNREASIAASAIARVTSEQMDELTNLLAKLGTSLAAEPDKPVEMADAFDLLDMEAEREVTEPPAIGARLADESANDEELSEDLPGDCQEGIIALVDEGDIDEMEPPRVISLRQAKDVCNQLYAFVSENAVDVARARTQESINYMRHIDIVRAAIHRMTVTTSHRQSNITTFCRALDPPTARQGMIEDSE